MISVILPAYNAQNTIGETIQSIITQTYRDWELIVINDGSTDDTRGVVMSFKDNRIRYIENDGNKKLIYTLNRGIELASGEYIARMDADDICHPNRFEKQVKYMESHPDVIVCGTQINYFGTKSSNYRKLVFPTKDKHLKEMLAMSTCFAHPTVMIRKSALIESGYRYDLDYMNAEDYSLWIDLMNYGKFGNLPDHLLNYRVSDTQVSQPSNPTTQASVLRCRRKYVERHLPCEIAEQLFVNNISINTIRRVKSLCKNNGVIEGCYLSLKKYTFFSLFYLLLSGDFVKIGTMGTIRFCKRMIKGCDPVYYCL